MSEAAMSDSKLSKELFVRSKVILSGGEKCVFIKKTGRFAVVVNKGGEGKMVCVSVQNLLDENRKASV